MCGKLESQKATSRLDSKSYDNKSKLPPDARFWAYTVLAAGIVYAIALLSEGQVIAAVKGFIAAGIIAVIIVPTCIIIEWFLKK